MTKLALIGYPLSKSLSKEVFKTISKKIKKKITFDTYETRKPIKTFKNLIKKYDGIFITIPYKEKIAKYLKTDKPINCIRACDIKSINTDLLAFKKLIKKYKIKGKTALIFGCGSTAITSILALKNLGIKKIYVSARNYKKLKKIKKYFKNIDVFEFNKCNNDYDILINATPIGMYEKGDINIKTPKLIVDWAYNNKKQTPLIKQAKKRKIKYIDGILILINQALIGYEFITKSKLKNKEKILKYLYREFI